MAALHLFTSYAAPLAPSYARAAFAQPLSTQAEVRSIRPELVMGWVMGKDGHPAASWHVERPAKRPSLPVCADHPFLDAEG